MSVYSTRHSDKCQFSWQFVGVYHRFDYNYFVFRLRGHIRRRPRRISDHNNHAVTKMCVIISKTIAIIIRGITAARRNHEVHSLINFGRTRTGTANDNYIILKVAARGDTKRLVCPIQDDFFFYIFIDNTKVLRFLCVFFVNRKF